MSLSPYPLLSSLFSLRPTLSSSLFCLAVLLNAFVFPSLECLSPHSVGLVSRPSAPDAAFLGPAADVTGMPLTHSHATATTRGPVVAGGAACGLGTPQGVPFRATLVSWRKLLSGREPLWWWLKRTRQGP